jgi:uncharacterized protein
MNEVGVRDRARSYFGDVSPCHDFQHVRRVVATAKRLAETTEARNRDGGVTVDSDVLVAAAWLHDVGRAREDRGEIDDHAEWGASESRTVLRDLGEDDSAFLDAVAHCVRTHRFSTDVEPETLEAQLLSDADNLDATGAVGIARVFAYAGEHDNVLYDPDLPPGADDTPAGETSFNHFHAKILTLEDRMYTDAGRALASDRQAFVEDYLERFEREAHGDA